jgi:hypothetical protein
MFPVGKNTQCKMMGCLAINELERMGKEVVVV